MSGVTFPTSYVYFKTTVENFQETYGTPYPKRNETIHTLIPRGAVIARIVGFIALGILISVKGAWLATPFLIYFVWQTVDKQVLGADPLIETFHKIVGGKDKFEALPRFALGPACLTDDIDRFQKECTDHPIYRAQTADGRNVIFVRRNDHTDEQVAAVEIGGERALSVTKPKIFIAVYIERAEPADFRPLPSIVRLNTTLPFLIFDDLHLSSDGSISGQINIFKSRKVRESVSDVWVSSSINTRTALEYQRCVEKQQ
jgi:hypothetical protein